jgi:hypothetical protein
VIVHFDSTGIYLALLDGKENRRVFPDISSALFAPPAHGGHTGHILFVRENTLMAAPFDATSAQLSGDVFPVAEGVPLSTTVLTCRSRSQGTERCCTKLVVLPAGAK